MADNSSIESQGMKVLKEWLHAQGRTFQESDDRTFDLIVDGEYAELKATARGWDRFDFISLTQNQKNALGDKLRRIFVVLEVSGTGDPEVIEVKAEELARRPYNEIIHYEWNKGPLSDLFGR